MGWLFAAHLTVAIISWIVLVRSERGTRLRRVLLVLLAAMPFSLFATVVVAAFLTAPAGEYRVALEGVSFRFTEEDSVTVGGASEGEVTDDLIVRGLPPHYLSFRREGNGIAVYLPPELDHDSDDPNYAAVRVDNQRPFANSVLLPIGGSIAIGGREPHPFDATGRAFQASGASYPPIPTRRQDVLVWSVPILKNLTAETAMYPLRFWARPAGSDDPAIDPKGAPLGSFFSFDHGFFRRSLYLTLAGDGTDVTVAGQPPVHYNPKVAEIAPGSEHHFAVYRLDYSDHPADKEARSLAQERRSFRASYNEGRLSIVFDTPEVVRLSPDAVRELLDRQKAYDSFLMVTRDPRGNAPVWASQMELSFRQLGRRIQHELYGTIKVTEGSGHGCAMRVTTHMGTKCHDLGDAFLIGDNASAIVRVTRILTPWGIVVTLFALFLLSLGWPPEAENDEGAVILISAAEILLAVRLLIAFEGGILDPSASAALWDSLAAYAILPFTLRVALIFRERQGAATRPSIPSSVTWYGRHTLPRALAVAALLSLAFWRAHLASAIVAAGASCTVLLPLFAGIAGPRLLDRFLRLSGRRDLVKIFTLGLTIAAIRGVMWLGLGWKERISLGGFDLAITALYLPAALLFFALLWQLHVQFDVSSKPLRAVWITVGAMVLGALLMVVMPYLVRDSGSVLVHVPAILLLFAIPALSRRPTARTIVLAAPLALLLLLHGVVLVLPHLRGSDDIAEPTKSFAYQSALANESKAEEFVKARLLSTNELRVMSQLSPNQLEAAGTSKAEGLVAQRRMLDRYSGRGWAGAGYLHVPLALFRDTHLNDNLSAIHVLAPFGVLGGGGIIALLGALAVLPPFVTLRKALKDGRSPEESINARVAFGLLCLWTFCIVGIYMFAANVGLVLFTGKNVYLLASASKSDAAEGGVLLLLALLSFQPPREKTA